MKNRWTDQEARDVVHRWGPTLGRGLALRLYTARLLGADPSLVLHGGGNVSIKGNHTTPLGESVDAVFVKRSGCDLASLEMDDLPALELEPLRRLQALDALPDEAMVNAVRRCLFDSFAPTPSIETLVHAFLPHRFVDHSHADAVLALTNQRRGKELVREALGARVAILDYVRPGFDLAKAVLEQFEACSDIEGIVLLHHGLITFGDDARICYDRHIALVDACEQFLERKAAVRCPARPHTIRPPETSAVRAACVLRGLLARRTGDEDRPYERVVLEWRSSDAILDLLDRTEAASWAATGPLTGDHLIHTRPKPLFIEKPDWSHEESLDRQLREAVAAYRAAYASYVNEYGRPSEPVDDGPRVVWLPGAGLLCWGPTKQAARITADIAEHTLVTKAKADAVGAYTSLPAGHLHDMEFRAAQRCKLSQRGLAAPRNGRPLAGQVVAVSGGAGAIGCAVGRVCAEAGAHVVLADVDEARLAKAVQGIDECHGDGTALGVVMDVTDEQSVVSGYRRMVRAFGGVDVIVPNAGIAHVAPIEAMRVEDFRRVLDVNATGYLLFMREGVRLLKRQGLGGHIVINASKNVFGPGKDFGAYSASKAAGHQLGKVAAIELAPLGIRVNMINADAVFGDEETPSGLWSVVGRERARSRSLDEKDLPEYYRMRSLLKTRVRGHHVGRAVVFFAGNATPTTGATLPVDGGVVEAFPR